MTDMSCLDRIADPRSQDPTVELRAVASATQPSLDAAARAARIEALQRRPHTGGAPRSRVASAGFGLATMLGLVAALGYADDVSDVSAETIVPATVAPPQVVVVIHPAGVAATEVPASDGPSTTPTPPNQPIALSAKPTVRQAPASKAPTGQTNGSR